MLRLVRVRGHSLHPDFREGDYVLIARFPFPSGRIRTGDVIVFQRPGYDRMIKRVFRVIEDESAYDVRGTQINSADSRDFGFVQQGDILGKVIWHIRQH